MAGEELVTPRPFLMSDPLFGDDRPLIGVKIKLSIATKLQLLEGRWSCERHHYVRIQRKFLAGNDVIL